VLFLHCLARGFSAAHIVFRFAKLAFAAEASFAPLTFRGLRIPWIQQHCADAEFSIVERDGTPIGRLQYCVCMNDWDFRKSTPSASTSSWSVRRRAS
jgi:hypothetical protein